MYYVYLIESLSAQGERYVGMTTISNSVCKHTIKEIFSYHKVQPKEANH